MIPIKAELVTDSTTQMSSIKCSSLIGYYYSSWHSENPRIQIILAKFQLIFIIHTVHIIYTDVNQKVKESPLLEVSLNKYTLSQTSVCTKEIELIFWEFIFQH